jgi:hypothetical protein
VSRKGEKQEDADSDTLEKLEEEYKRELMALKRLIAYKGHKADDGKKYERIRR